MSDQTPRNQPPQSATNTEKEARKQPGIGRRDFVKASAALASTGALAASDLSAAEGSETVKTIGFPAQDSLVHPPEWESLNPGFWKVEKGQLRRRLTNVGDRARKTGFPFHYESKGTVMDTEYDPSLPSGIIYRRDQYLKGPYNVEAKFVFHGRVENRRDDDDPNWKMYRPGHALMGIAIGAKSLLESYNSVIGATQFAWSDNEKLVVVKRARWKKGVGLQHNAQSDNAFPLAPGDTVAMSVKVTPRGQQADVVCTLRRGDDSAQWRATLPIAEVEGYVGIVGRGLADFSVQEMTIRSQNQPLDVKPCPCLACYALGDTLQQNDAGQWTVRFVAMFSADGSQAAVRIAISETPDGGWVNVPEAGNAKIISNDFRRNTAVIEAVLPGDPGETDLFYTIWQDGRDVTADDRIGTDAVGRGTGLVGDVPSSGSYVGRLPKLAAPYRLCGLSCHAITSGLQMKTDDGYEISGARDAWQFRDQPTEGAYAHLDDYNFQVMVWEDDVWYMELVLYPPSTDDAYKIVAHSICGPTSRWQMMRHWNVINPGDHDYGMDDVKGPEQIVIRNVDGLGQDADYMRRNFQIVHHLITGDEEVDPLANPKKWRAWKMPRRDFTFVILDSRLWRSSQYVDMWNDFGWAKFKSLYDRTDPTRSLLGEEQFGWLQELLATDSSRLMCLTGINGLHTIWTGGKGDSESSRHPMKFSQRDRVTADYAGWVKAGADRVLELLGQRDGVITVYGDVHNGSITTNTEHRVIECSFGPIGRSGGRGVIPGFGPKMKDVDGRDVQIHALYHKEFSDPDLNGHQEDDPFYWNFLEMAFDPRPDDPSIALTIRNLVDSPDQDARGGAELLTTASQTGRVPTCKLPAMTTLSRAEIQILDLDGKPIRGTISLDDGTIKITGLADVSPGTDLLILAHNGTETEAKRVTTLPIS